MDFGHNLEFKVKMQNDLQQRHLAAVVVNKNGQVNE